MDEDVTMSSADLRTYHLIAARHRLGFCQSRMALLLGLSPLEIAEAEADAVAVNGLPISALPPRTEAKLCWFLTNHPFGMGLLEHLPGVPMHSASGTRAVA